MATNKWTFVAESRCLLLVLLFSILGCRSSPTLSHDAASPTAQEKSATPAAVKQYDVLANFVASGWMGDCQKGPPVCTWTPASRTNPHSPPLCVQVTYRPGAAGWGGIYLQHPPDNWGKLPGRNLSQYRRLTFWARADGDAYVEFKSGGINTDGLPHRDSYEASLGTVQLTSEWRQFTIDLEGCKLSDVIGAFAWVATKASNPNGVTFYIDDVYLEN